MRSLTAGLDPRVRRLFVGVAFSALGSGLTLPFLYVYLARVREIPTTTVGLLLAWMGVVGLVSAPVAGTLIDRLGPRPVIAAGLLVEAMGVAVLGFVTSTGQAFAVLGVISLGQVAIWPATTALLARLVAEESRQRVFGLQFMLLNAGLGAGGLVSAGFVDLDSPSSFTNLYLLDALTYLVYVAVVLSLPPGTGAAAPPDAEAVGAGRQPGWAVVLRDRRLVRFAATSALVVTCGYAQFEAGFAAYAVDVAGVDPRALGPAFAANTAAIILGQMLTLRLIEGRRRSRMLALCAAVWSAAWVVVALSAVVPAWLAVLCVVVGLGVFGAGETLWAPVAPAVVNSLAPEELRGRYNAVQSGTWTVSLVIGPAVAGLLIGTGLAWLWVVVTVGGTALAARLFLGLRDHLTDEQDGVPAAGSSGPPGSSWEVSRPGGHGERS